MTRFRVALTGDMQARDGGSAYPMVDLSPLLRTGRAEIGYVPVPPDKLVRAADLESFDALVLCECGVGPDSAPANGRLALVARFGVGYDDIALDAMTENGVLVTNAPDGVRRPMAVGVLALLFALTNRVIRKNELARQGPAGWSKVAEHLGVGLVGRTLGIVGLGGIGAELARIARPLDMVFIAHDPYADPARARALGVELVDLDDLCRRADFISINCPLNEATERLITARHFALMKPTAYFINTARGRIVDQAALTQALEERRIAGAGIDVFETEPAAEREPIMRLDNVIVAPHHIGMTDQCFADIGKTSVEAALALMRGEIPANVVNRAVLENPVFRAKLARYASEFRGSM